MIALLTALFVVSGAAGLIYESIWSRYLSLFVGHGAYAQVIVLVIFLGGMSVGAALAGRWSARLRRPLLWYAGVEALAGAGGLLFHPAFLAATGWAYDVAFPALGRTPLATFVQWLLAALLLLPQSVLLGATFPLLAAGAIRIRPSREGAVIAQLYFANSLGGAAGVLLAGFALVAWVGLPGTVATAAALNVGVSALVVVAVLVAAARESGPAPPPLGTAPRGGAAAVEYPLIDADRARRLLVVACGTAVASFIYEIAWVRMLSLVLGGATHSFELMLSAFVLGLALGAWWVRGRIERIPDPVAFLGVVQWAMGMLAMATLPVYLASFGWMATLLATFQTSDAGYRAFSIARYALCLAVMLPATFCAGMTLPLITHSLMRARPACAERAIGAVYAVNTLGSIAGVVLAALVLLPLLGLELLVIAGALIDAGLGVMLLADRRPSAPRARLAMSSSSRLTSAIVATAVLVAGILTMTDFDRGLLTSGVYRYAMVSHRGDVTIPFYADGRTATASIRRTASGFLTLSTNGKPDASLDAFWRDSAARGAPRPLGDDIATQLLLPIITLAHRPGARDAAVIGLGSGMSSHVLLGGGAIRDVTTLEIEPAMVEAARWFRPANHRVFDDPRSHLVLDDARAYFAASGRRFDLILSEPSNPWVSGVSGLFTVEFYERVRRHLAPGGVFGQWLHLYELNDPLALSVLAALDRSFASYEIFYVSNADILIVASNERALPAPRWSVVSDSGIAHDLARAIRFDPAVLDATRLGGRALLHPYLATSMVPNSDFAPMLDLGAERSRYLHENAQALVDMGRARFDVAAALAGRRRSFGTSYDAVVPDIARVAALSLGARLGAGEHGGAGAPASPADAAALRRARQLLDGLAALAARQSAPPSWALWVEDVAEAERALHGGTAGVADEPFYDAMSRYAARAGAPAAARAALDFLHALAAWRFADASRAGETLIGARSTDHIDWLPPATVRTGLVVARLALGDEAGARAAFHAFAGSTDTNSLMDRVLAAYLLDQERRRGE